MSGSGSSLARSWATKLSTVRAGAGLAQPHTRRNSCSRENTRCSGAAEEASSSNSRWVSLTGSPARVTVRAARSIATSPKRNDDGLGARRRSAAGRAARLRAAQHGLDAREELGERERLGDVVVGAQAQRRHLVELVLSRRQHDHRHEVVCRRAASRAPRGRSAWAARCRAGSRSRMLGRRCARPRPRRRARSPSVALRA